MRFVILTIAAMMPFAAQSDAGVGQSETKQICARSAEMISSGKIEDAYQQLIPFWPLPKEEIQNLGYQTKSQLGMVGERFGAPTMAEFVSTSLAGTSILRHDFLLKHEKHAIRFSCVFYKPRDTWYVNAVFWDDKPHTLLGE